jgi:hypothetical protein
LISNEKAEELAADLWQYAASLWGNNANGERIIMEFAGQRLRELTAKAIRAQGMTPMQGMTSHLRNPFFCLCSLCFRL